MMKTLQFLPELLTEKKKKSIIYYTCQMKGTPPDARLFQTHKSRNPSGCART